MTTADDLLRRLVEWDRQRREIGGNVIWDSMDLLISDARTYLAREKSPMASGLRVVFEQIDDPREPPPYWRVRAANGGEEWLRGTWVQIPVPRHLYAPETLEGEVIP